MNRLDRNDEGLADVAAMVGELVSGYFGDETSFSAEITHRSGPLVHTSRAAGPDSLPADAMYFATFGEASTWARQNPGRIITPSPQGNGYVGR